ncbi:hypothetical protein CY34DRAFT_813660, partial [Suillus luteus UH-Slu-Lm8-n1]
CTYPYVYLFTSPIALRERLARTAHWWRYASYQGIRESGDAKEVFQGTQLGPIGSETKCNARDLDPSTRGHSGYYHVYSIMHMNQQPLLDNMNDLLVHQCPMWHLCSIPMNAGRRGVHQKKTI